MMNQDTSCQKRIKEKAECQNPLGGIIPKLAFFDHIILDPVENRSQFPSTPIELHKNTQKLKVQQVCVVVNDSSLYSDQHRSKRQITVGVVALSVLTSTLAGAAGAYAAILTMQQEFETKMNEYQDEENKSWNQINENVKHLSEKIIGLETVQYAQDSQLSHITNDILKLEEEIEIKNLLLQSEISENQKIGLLSLNEQVRSIKSLSEISMGQLILDKLILQSLINQTGVKSLKNTTLYLSRIANGNLYLKQYAHQLEQLINQTQTQMYKEHPTFQNITRILKDRIDATSRLLVNVSKDDNIVPTYINISDPQWNAAPLNVNFNSTNITFQDAINNIVGGLDVIPDSVSHLVKEVVSDVGDVIGSGLKNLLQSLLPILIPVAVVVGGITLLCCIIQLHPRCKRQKKQMNSFFQKRYQQPSVHLQDMMHSKWQPTKGLVTNVV